MDTARAPARSFVRTGYSEWRFGRGWTSGEIEERLRELESRAPNFEIPPDRRLPGGGWQEFATESLVGHEAPGPPLRDGLFQRAAESMIAWSFSDPGIVAGYFRPDEPLLGRHLLLEIRALGVRYLGAARVGAVRREPDVFGYRYDTLQGHIEAGTEWFLLAKEMATGAVRFRIEATWRTGDLPNWWSRIGFPLLSPLYRRLWHHRAHQRLRRIANAPGSTGV